MVPDSGESPGPEIRRSSEVDQGTEEDPQPSWPVRGLAFTFSIPNVHPSFLPVARFSFLGDWQPFPAFLQ
eukprot:CAMPEP_0113688678 /NCGR_PEP_ID=MMETSP0038_2-20120614/16677_1 /TAXON_ID=2898 /ORGANISM="Cryptomonas paramecium" /LENGTH=69 /DNA_ID=CAMNT_0000609535 /DNA_START=1140 /DNA_END=1349 /DNA_ORIENTATION=- /assembly_acc=CAM_ASM_000170